MASDHGRGLDGGHWFVPE